MVISINIEEKTVKNTRYIAEKDFISKYASLKPSKHIYDGHSSSEENAKIKFVIPLLNYLGYDTVDNLYFESSNIDILVKSSNETLFAVECKSWQSNIDRHLKQYLEYMYISKTPFILVSSGQQNAIYSALLNPTDLSKTTPILYFTFDNLLSNKGHATLLKLNKLMGKKASVGGFIELRKEIGNIAGSTRKLIGLETEFNKLAKNYKRKLITHKLTDEQFAAYANSYPKETSEAIMYLREVLSKLEDKTANLQVRYRSKSIGIEYIDNSGPRIKKIGLFDIYPIDGAGIALGVDGWRKLNVNPKVLLDLQACPKNITNMAGAKKLAKILNEAFKTNNLHLN